jgi:hypothetical protein
MQPACFSLLPQVNIYHSEKLSTIYQIIGQENIKIVSRKCQEKSFPELQFNIRQFVFIVLNILKLDISGQAVQK